jgi:hypothetical protein
MRKINVAISLTCPANGSKSIWNNGGNQHSIFMYLLLKQLPYVENAWIVSNIKPDDLESGMFLDQYKEDIFHFDDVIDQVDLLIEMTAYIGTHHAEAVRKRGGKLVSYKFGNDYVMSVESCSFGAHKGWVPHPNRIAFDEVWTNAQHINTCQSYFEHLYKAPVEVLPHLWAPIFIEEAIQRNPQTAQGWPYKQRGEKAVVSMFEPNINIVKSSIIPFYAAAKFYEDNPSLVSNIYILNTLHLTKNSLFSRLVSDTKAGKDNVASAERRHPFADFMGKYGGIVLSHQWENGLNYVYYEALYGGFPLVHNSPFLKDVGYYYEGFDIDDGARALQIAWETHDENLHEYQAKAHELLSTISPFDEGVIAAYDARIMKLMA